MSDFGSHNSSSLGDLTSRFSRYGDSTILDS